MQKIPARILVVDDDPDVLTAARVVLRQKFESVETETNPQKLNFLLNQNRYDVILLDMNYSSGKTTGSEGIFWLQQILSAHPQQIVVTMTGYGDIKVAVEAMKHGAADFIVKPWDNEKMEATVSASYQLAQTKHELRELKDRQSQFSRAINPPPDEFIGSSSAVRQLLQTVDKVAGTEANVLLLGENGTGKELVAKLIHHHSSRSRQPFIKVDVGSLSQNLFESELFGHKKGAFTDAREERIGRMELAHGGTLFLDEVGNLPVSLQSKLLSALQNREVIPLGGNKPVPIDIRLICATNLDIHNAVDSGVFREDLLYRINTVEITLPPLRSRTEDIPVLSKYFLRKHALRYRKEKTIPDETTAYLQRYPWPGNVRELEHAIERAVIMSEGPELKPKDFLFAPRKANEAKTEALNLEGIEKKAIIAAIRKYHGNLSKVAKELGVGRTTLYRKMIRYGIEK